MVISQRWWQASTETELIKAMKVLWSPWTKELNQEPRQRRHCGLNTVMLKSWERHWDERCNVFLASGGGNGKTNIWKLVCTCTNHITVKEGHSWDQKCITADGNRHNLGVWRDYFWRTVIQACPMKFRNRRLIKKTQKYTEIICENLVIAEIVTERIITNSGISWLKY